MMYSQTYPLLGGGLRERVKVFGDNIKSLMKVGKDGRRGGVASDDNIKSLIKIDKEGKKMFEKFEKYAEKTFVGFCTEPEIKYSDKGTASCKFSIPLKETKDSKDCLWLNCKTYKDTAEAFAEICKKGCLVKVSGRFYQYEYNSNIYTEFFVREFLKLSDPIEKPKGDEQNG